MVASGLAAQRTRTVTERGVFPEMTASMQSQARQERLRA